MASSAIDYSRDGPTAVQKVGARTRLVYDAEHLAQGRRMSAGGPFGRGLRTVKAAGDSAELQRFSHDDQYVGGCDLCAIGPDKSAFSKQNTLALECAFAILASF
jgi:hypothetical protein